MSSYISFYMNNADQCICSYSRNSTIYHAFESIVSYGKVHVLTHEIIREAKDILHDELNSYTQAIDKHNQTLTIISITNNSIEEKTKAILTELSAVMEYQEDIDSIKEALCYLHMLDDIITEAKYSDTKNTIYVGIDAEWPDNTEE